MSQRPPSLSPRTRRLARWGLVGVMLALALLELCIMAPALHALPPHGAARRELWLCCILAGSWVLVLGAGLLVVRTLTWGALLIAASSLVTAPLISEPLLGRDLFPLFVRYHLPMLILSLLLALRGHAAGLLARLEDREQRHLEEDRARRPPPGDRAELADSQDPGSPALAATPGSELDQLWELLSSARFFFLTPGAVYEQRLDSPGRFTSLGLLGVTQRFWQYQHNNLLFFRIGGVLHLYLPPEQKEPLQPFPQVSNLEHLTGRAWIPRRMDRPLEKRYACCFALQQDARRYADRARVEPESLDEFGPELDLAPHLHDELHRIVASRDPLAIASVITLLDILSVFQGHGSSELRPASVRFADEAVSLLAEHQGTVADALRSELLAHAPRPRPEPGLEPDPDRICALVHKTEHLDGTSDGLRSQIALVTISRSERGWRYQRAVVWSHSRAGRELS